jgi:prolyl oligopeptidase
MLRKRFLLSISLALFALGALVNQTGFFSSAQRMLAPPKTRADNVSENIHGVTITDPYRWLEDQDSPDTRAWINEQNQYAQTVLSTLPGRSC